MTSRLSPKQKEILEQRKYEDFPFSDEEIEQADILEDAMMTIASFYGEKNYNKALVLLRKHEGKLSEMNSLYDCPELSRLQRFVEEQRRLYAKRIDNNVPHSLSALIMGIETIEPINRSESSPPKRREPLTLGKIERIKSPYHPWMYSPNSY
ncbi:hypothetical protein J4474_01335 [Candidatus Pacearchaeota archaeon]|nr:hypothetical protein [Candidatus Pacearchaeota archaeon]